jgi:hypothetical protein
LWSFQERDTKLERSLAKNQLQSNEILYPSLENSTTGIAIVFNSNWIDFYYIINDQ